MLGEHVVRNLHILSESEESIPATTIRASRSAGLSATDTSEQCDVGALLQRRRDHFGNSFHSKPSSSLPASFLPTRQMNSSFDMYDVGVFL